MDFGVSAITGFASSKSTSSYWLDGNCFFFVLALVLEDSPIG